MVFGPQLSFAIVQSFLGCKKILGPVIRTLELISTYIDSTIAYSLLLLEFYCKVTGFVSRRNGDYDLRLTVIFTFCSAWWKVACIQIKSVLSCEKSNQEKSSKHMTDKAELGQYQ
jgi:hypothetical protein